MYFRCPDCRAATWHDDDAPVGEGDELVCGGCARTLVARPHEELGSSTAEHFRAMLRTANQLGIDAAGAYSVLLGLAAPEALRVGTRESEPVPGAPVASEVRTPASGARLGWAGLAQVADYDPAFRASVASGRMTVQEAVLRGDREAFVVSLAARHGLPRALAEQVADNRISLSQALVARPPRPERPAGSSSGRRSVSRLAALAAVSVLCTATLWTSTRWNQSFPEPERPRAPRTAAAAVVPAARSPREAPPGLVERRRVATEIRRDAEGEVVEIVGPDPAAVLVAYCGAGEVSGRLAPLEITETSPRLVEARLGLFRDEVWPEVPRAIWMRKDHRTQRWVAGDGKGPIPVRVAPQLPPGSRREPLVPGVS